MIQSSQQVWSAAELPDLSESSLAGGLWGLAASPNGQRPSASEAGDRSPRAKLDSDKFGDEAGDQSGGLIEPYTRLKFSIT